MFEKWRNDQRREIFSLGKAKIRRNTLCISRIFNAAQRKKIRRLGVLSFFKHALNLNWLLIGSIYGPGRNDNNILTYTIKALLRGEEPKYSKMEQMWDYIYIDDLIEALYLLGLHGKPDGVYPLGSGQARPLAEYIRQIQAEIAPNAPLGIGALPYKLGGKPDNSVLDITRLREDTGFEPQVSFEEGIARTIRYFKEMEHVK